MKAIFTFGFIVLFAYMTTTAQAQSDLRKANKLYRQNEYAAAVPYYKKAIQADSNEVALYGIASCYRLTNNYKEAELWYGEIIRLDIAQPIHRYYYGQVLKSNGKYEKAKEQFQKYLNEAPDDFKGKVMLASCDTAIKMMREKPNYKAEPISFVNTTRSDYSPVIHNNGLIYTSTRESATNTTISTRSGEPLDRIIAVDRVSDKSFKNSNSLSDKMERDKSIWGEGTVTFDPSGKYMFFTRAVSRKFNPDINPMGIMVLKIFMAENVNGVWQNIQALPFNSDRYNCAHPSLSKDGKTLYFSSNMPGGYGGKDIWRVTYDQYGWSEPENLGEVINTEGNEAFPYIHEDGTFFFASDFHPGLGGFDIFMAPTKDGKFEKIYNLRAGINSPADDFGIALYKQKLSSRKKSGYKGYVSSNRTGGNGADDIYYVEVSLPNDTNKVIIKGLVMEQLIGRYLETPNEYDFVAEGPKAKIPASNITLRNGANNAQIRNVSTDANGAFSFEMEYDNSPATYAISAQKAGYSDATITLRKTDFVYRNENLETDVSLDQQRIEMIKRFGPIRFDLNKAYVKTQVDTIFTELQRITSVLKRYPAIKIDLEGNTCSLGPDKLNDTLSLSRARAIERYLIDNGISSMRIVSYGFGEKKLLISPEKKKADYEFNRRTEFKVRDPKSSDASRFIENPNLTVKEPDVQPEVITQD